LHFKNLWLVLAAYGVWFAIFSGLEEVFYGKLWKVVLSAIFGLLVYIAIEIYLPLSDKQNNS